MADIRAVVGSHISQRGKGEAYAESQNWTVVGAFEDLDVSAIKLSPWDRPDLKVWLSDERPESEGHEPLAAIGGQRPIRPPRITSSAASSVGILAASHVSVMSGSRTGE